MRDQHAVPARIGHQQIAGQCPGGTGSGAAQPIDGEGERVDDSFASSCTRQASEPEQHIRRPRHRRAAARPARPDAGKQFLARPGGELAVAGVGEHRRQCAPRTCARTRLPPGPATRTRAGRRRAAVIRQQAEHRADSDAHRATANACSASTSWQISLLPSMISISFASRYARATDMPIVRAGRSEHLHGGGRALRRVPAAKCLATTAAVTISGAAGVPALAGVLAQPGRGLLGDEEFGEVPLRRAGARQAACRTAPATWRAARRRPGRPAECRRNPMRPRAGHTSRPWSPAMTRAGPLRGAAPMRATAPTSSQTLACPAARQPSGSANRSTRTPGAASARRRRPRRRHSGRRPPTDRRSRAGHPDLVPVDDHIVAVTTDVGAHRGQVAAGRRFAERDARQLAPGQPRQVGRAAGPGCRSAGSSRRPSLARSQAA